MKREASGMTEVYLALLRGINVGGKNKVPMAELKACFEELGCENVRTYIASGNVTRLSHLAGPWRGDTGQVFGIHAA